MSNIPNIIDQNTFLLTLNNISNVMAESSAKSIATIAAMKIGGWSTNNDAMVRQMLAHAFEGMKQESEYMYSDLQGLHLSHDLILRGIIDPDAQSTFGGVCLKGVPGDIHRQVIDDVEDEGLRTFMLKYNGTIIFNVDTLAESMLLLFPEGVSYLQCRLYMVHLVHHERQHAIQPAELFCLSNNEAIASVSNVDTCTREAFHAYQNQPHELDADEAGWAAVKEVIKSLAA